MKMTSHHLCGKGREGLKGGPHRRMRLGSAAVAILGLIALAPPLLSTVTQQQQPAKVARPRSSPRWASASREPLPLLPEWASMPLMPLLERPRGPSMGGCGSGDGGGVDYGEGGDGEVAGGREAEAEVEAEEDLVEGGSDEEGEGEGEGEGERSAGEFCEKCKSKDWKNNEIPSETIDCLMEQLEEWAEEDQKKMDEWSKRMWKLADDYDIKGLDEAMWQRREELEIPSGKPLWIQLPNEGDNWIDASKLTTGTVIEAILTCGAMLQRDADGRVSASIFTDMDERVRRAEPIWSLARHRVVMGVDEWDESDGGERYDLDEVADEMLGPYKEVFDRCYYTSNHTDRDEERLQELLVWSNQKQIDEAKGQNKTNELLWNAARIGDMTQAELLVKKAGAELAAIDRSSGMTALHHAVNQAQGRMASHLISLGSAVNQRDADSMTPLHIAAAQANTSMAALLLGHGAEVNPADSMGWTPMHHVAASNPLTDQGNITRLLVASGADLGARDALNRTPAELADALGEVDLAEFLSAMERGDGSVEETAMGMTLPVPQPSWDDAARRSTRGGEECSLEELLRIYRLGKGTAAAGTEGAQTATATATTTPTARMEGGDGGDNDGNCDGRDRMFEPFRRYDGKDWADGKEPEKIKELVGLMETFPAAFFNEEQFKRLESAGLIERRLDWVEAGARAEEERKRRAAATMKEYAQLW